MTDMLEKDTFVKPTRFYDIDNNSTNLENLNSIVTNVNGKNIVTFEMLIDDTARNISFVPTVGSFLIAVQGNEDTMPTCLYACCKSTSTGAGSVSSLAAQAGTGTTWNTNALTISAAASNYQIAHDLAVVVGTFYITVIGVL